MYDFQKWTTFLQKWILNPQDLPKNRSLETVPVCIVWQCFPHKQYCLYSHVWWMYEINRFRRLPQALVHFVIDLASLFTDHRISDLPIRSKYKHFRKIWEHTCDNSSNKFHFFFFFEVVVIGCMELVLCGIVEPSCLLTHSIVPHISWHDLPYRRTTMRFENSESMEIFQLLLRKFWIQTWLCNCPQYLCLFHNVFECSPSIHDQGTMLVLPNRLLYWVLSTSDQDFVSFQPILCHPHTQIRIILFDGVRGFSQIAFPTIVLPKNDRTDSGQEERPGSSTLDNDLGH